MGAADLFTLQDIATEVGQTYGSTDTITLAKCKKWINRALVDISGFGPWPFLKDGDETLELEDDTSEYTLPCVVKEIRKLYYRDNDDYSLNYVPYDRWIDVIVDDQDADGTPTHYTIVGWDQYTHGWKIRLWPQPSAAKTLYVSADKYIALFDSDKDDLRDRMPETMLPVVIAIAEKYALRDLNEITELQRDQQVEMLLTKAQGKHFNKKDMRHRARAHDGSDADPYRDPRLPPNYS